MKKHLSISKTSLHASVAGHFEDTAEDVWLTTAHPGRFRGGKHWRDGSDWARGLSHKEPTLTMKGGPLELAMRWKQRNKSGGRKQRRWPLILYPDQTATNSPWIICMAPAKRRDKHTCSSLLVWAANSVHFNSIRTFFVTCHKTWHGNIEPWCECSKFEDKKKRVNLKSRRLNKSGKSIQE